MHLIRANVAGAESPMILGSIATPVLSETARSRDLVGFLADGDEAKPRSSFAHLGRIGGNARFGTALMRWRSH